MYARSVEKYAARSFAIHARNFFRQNTMGIALGIILELNQDFFVHRLPASQLLTSFPMDFPPTFPFLPHSEPKANRRRCSLPSTTWKARRSCPSRSDVGLSSTTR